MPMEEALVARLIAVPAIAALVGDRVDWFDRPGAMPAVTLSKVAPGRAYTHDGPDRLDAPRVQFDCWASTKAAAAALGRAVQAEMEQARDVGAVGGGTRFHAGWVEMEMWDRDDDQAGGIPVLRATIDVTFMHEAL